MFRAIFRARRARPSVFARETAQWSADAGYHPGHEHTDLIDLGRDPIRIAENRRDLAGAATLEWVWAGEGDYGLEVGLLKASSDLSAPAMRRAWEARRAG